MKKVATMIFVLILLPVLCCSAVTVNQEMLSDLSDEAHITFLESYGIEIPRSYSQDMSWTPFIRYVIECVEENPDVNFAFGNSVALNFAYEIKGAVNDYYGHNEKSVRALQDDNNQLVLQDNIIVGQWSDEYETFNCYSFAIEYYEINVNRMNPGVISWKNDGNEVADHIYNWRANILTVAGWVRDDLESLGYTVTAFTTIIPATVVSDHTRLICVRVDNDGEFLYGHNDFHLMKLEEDGFWYHKPGKTCPLKYKYTPSSGTNWVLEYYDGEKTVREEVITYDSEIYFIEYTTPHTYAYRFMGCSADHHIRTCTVCGETVGAEMSCIYINNVCKGCGRIKITGGGIITSVNKEDGE